MPYHSLLLHLLIEIPACFIFLLFPSSTLLIPQPYAHSVIRQYGLLLVSTNLVAAGAAYVSVTEGGDILIAKLVRWTQGALALYHIGPVLRASSRAVDVRDEGRWVTGWLFASVHAFCGGWLALDASSVKNV